MRLMSILPALVALLVLMASSLSTMAFAGLGGGYVAASDASIDKNRKRDCTVLVTDDAGALQGVSVKVEQVRSHFGFGAAIGYEHLTEVSGYAEAFLKFFEWAVFENDLKWPATDYSPAGPDYTKPDSLLRFCRNNDIKVRAHNLFWNQKEQWFPPWTMELNKEDFKKAVDNRINNAMTHYKGKVEHWDIINEIIHGSVLQDHSGDNKIINSIFKKAAQIDPAARLTVNDYNILVWNSTDKYINNVKSMLNAGVPIHIVGCEGHFGNNLNQNYAGKLAKVASLKLPIWITELDFSVTKNKEDEFEKLLRTFFGHPLVEGVVFWVWWEGNKWRENLTSSVVTKDFKNTSIGTRYLNLKKAWTTNTSGTTDGKGAWSFRGFHGKYLVTAQYKDFTSKDTLYLEPGKSNKQWNLKIEEKVGISNYSVSAGEMTVRIDGLPVAFQSPSSGGGEINVAVYSLSGRLLEVRKLEPNQGSLSFRSSPGQCRLYRIQSAGQVLKTWIGYNPQ